jgi:hypothetical protein
VATSDAGLERGEALNDTGLASLAIVGRFHEEAPSDENEPHSKFANFGDYFGTGSTLGDKLATNDRSPVRWMPIKSFLHDDTAVGVNRLIDAISSFGAEAVTDANVPSRGVMEGGVLEQLTAQHEMGRVAQLNRIEFRALLD